MYNACNSAQAFAREVGVHRTTVVDWINKGRITTLTHGKGRRWFIGEMQFRQARIEKFKKPYAKYSMNYSKAEIETILAFPNASDKTLSQMLKRSKNAIHIKRWRMKQTMQAPGMR